MLIKLILFCQCGTEENNSISIQKKRYSPHSPTLLKEHGGEVLAQDIGDPLRTSANTVMRINRPAERLSASQEGLGSKEF